jgi:type I restriction enzyme S subunit
MIREGYQQTAIGLIPIDWEVEELGDIINYTKGFPFKSKDYQKDGVRIIRVSDTTYDSIKEDNQIYINENKKELYSNWELKENDLVISTVGSKPPMYDSMVGKVIFINKKYQGSLLNQNAVLIRVKDKNFDKQKIIYFNLKNQKYLYHIESIYRGNANQASINLDDLFSFKIPLPPPPEQKAIAEVLGDVDRLINACDKLIAKKRDIKQGVMQELLTGRSRLPGFSGEWEVKTLENVAPLQRGFDLPTSQIKKGIYPVVYSNGIVNYHHQFQVKAPGVVTGRSGTIGKVNYITKNYWTHNTSLWVTDFKGNFPLFIYYLYIHIHLERFGTGSGVPTLNRNDVHSFKVPLPPTLEEQKAIAQILSDMDSEIEALEKKRDKYKLIKQGMMQELLTGKTRILRMEG